jgi:CRISPR-associated protein Cmr6
MINQVRIREKLAGSEQSKNASLWLHKHIQDYTPGESRSNLVKEVAEVLEPPEYNAYFARWKKALIREYGEQNTRLAQVKGRMVVGLGSESVLETSICLHRTYGVPYIPGSALKGLAASYAHQRLGEGWQQGEKYHTIVFGNTETAGYITFFDALYIPGTGFKKKALYPDIITVHHPKYYQNAAKAPSDSDDPKPVPFLSATGQYLLVLAAPDLPTRWIDITFQILAEALMQFGIGAKTSSGYGRMTLLGQFVRSGNAPIEPGKSVSTPYVRPNIPRFTPGQGIVGLVIAPTDELRQRIPEARAFLRYREFSTRDVLIVVSEGEAAGWTSGQTKNCLFVSEEERNGGAVIFCLPGVKKEKKKER